MATAPEEESSVSKTETAKRDTTAAPRFLEVLCKSTGKVKRFAAGTEAGFASDLINRKNVPEYLPALYIEAIKEGEEPVSFGPSAVLVKYGQDWKLQTVIEEGEGKEKVKSIQQSLASYSRIDKLSKVHPNEEMTNSDSSISLNYIGKIFLAFTFIFLIGAVFTYILETLPELIVHVTSSQ